ncbi:hypothetical protein [Streptomyces inhibens]|uniref:P-type ATPase n=1 Tax=Streptomyces inhibens TaxID=2293571 RepID=UPI0024797869|nr:hypothetical protein [Streptomyces inhibens]UKY47914.1 hypothetical protein KI385_03175 [Streptomyces inhibens]
MPHRCRVLRGGEASDIPVVGLVPGDVVLWEAGDAVPADCRLVEAHDVTVNNAALTGESAPVAPQCGGGGCGPGAPGPQSRLHGHRWHLRERPRRDVRDRNRHRVRSHLQTGRSRPEAEAPLQHQVAAMAHRVAGTAIAIGGLLFAVRLPAGEGLVPSFVFALGVMVALVPEGLPATL